MQDEDKIFGLIAQAEDIQKYAISLQSTAESVVKNIRVTAEDALKKLPDASRSAVRDATREILIEGAEKASRGILDASRGAIAAAEQMRRVTSGAWLIHAFYLFLVAVVIFAALYFGSGFLLDRRMAELTRLKDSIQQEQTTLTELQSKTWGLELIKFRDGRGIILPKGQQFERLATMNDDGRAVAILK